MLQVNCENYASDIEVFAAGFSEPFTFGIDGGPAPCGTPFNLLRGLIEGGLGYGEIISGIGVVMCLSDGATDCLTEPDGSTVTTSYSPLVVSLIGFIAHRPEVLINSPETGSALGPTTVIEYIVSDEDDKNYPNAGLGESPVEIFYSDDNGINWFLVAQDRPKSGSYQWDTSFIPEGNYWIKIKATDLSSDFDEELSGPFSVDRILPTFGVFADPPVSKGENVKIFIIPSEELRQSPDVSVKQRNYAEVPVYPRTLSFEEALPELTRLGISITTFATSSVFYQGEYEVRPGFDGTAIITISGKDKSGNIGNIIKDGGFFNIGTEPPPRPVVIYPLDNEILGVSTTSVAGGNVREDTKAVLLVNEERKYEILPDKEGNFSFENIILSETFNNGFNILKIFSEDQAGNKSEPAALGVKRNFAPEVSILSPAPNSVIFGTTTIAYAANDRNFEKSSFDIEVSPDDGLSWEKLAENIQQPRFDWVTFVGSDGKYLLRISAFDGFSTSYATASVTVRNHIPAILWDKTGDIISNTGNVFIGVTASSSAKTISGAEYRLDAGLAEKNKRPQKDGWIALAAIDGSFDSVNEKLKIEMANIAEGAYTLWARAKDSRGFYGYGSKSVIVDFSSPPPPVIKSVNQLPVTTNQLLIISDADDVEPDRAGVQVRIGGIAEKFNSVGVAATPRVVSTRGVDETPLVETASGVDGVFSIVVTIRTHGENILNILSEDLAGNKSLASQIKLIYNNPPTIRAVDPRDGDGIGVKYKIRWEGQDRDLDQIGAYNLYWRAAVPATRRVVDNTPCCAWTTLVKDLQKPEFIWDVSGFPEGFYELKIEATDGVSTGEKIIKIFIDNTAPEISIAPFEKTVFNNKSFRLNFTGAAEDNFSGIQFVEYSLLAPPTPPTPRVVETDWHKTVITYGFRTRTAKFKVSHPAELKDGDYQIAVRAIDVAGNISKIKTQKIIIDITPPRIGPISFLYKGFELLPSPTPRVASTRGVEPPSPTPRVASTSGVEPEYEILEGETVKLLQSLENDTIKAELIFQGLALEDTRLSLGKNGVWEADMTVLTRRVDATTPRVDVFVEAEDHAGNKTEKPIAKIKVLKRGTVATPRVASTRGVEPLPSAKITVKTLDQDSKQYARWNAEEYGMENPVFATSDAGATTDDSRTTYSLFLPSGEYIIEASAPKHDKIKTEEFEIQNPRFINFDFALKSRKGVGGWIKNLWESVFE